MVEMLFNMYILLDNSLGGGEIGKDKERVRVKCCMILMKCIAIQHIDCYCIRCFKIKVKLFTFGIDFCLFIERPVYIKI